MSRWPRAVAILRVAFAEAPKLRSCSEAVIWLGKQAGTDLLAMFLVTASDRAMPPDRIRRNSQEDGRSFSIQILVEQGSSREPGRPQLGN